MVGRVTDPSGAAVANATVTLKNEDTGATQTATSNGTGAYRFSLLNPGHYDVSAAAQGFRGREQPFVIAVGQDNTVNLGLQVASSSQTVEVYEQRAGPFKLTMPMSPDHQPRDGCQYS